MTRDDHSDIETESGALRISRSRQRAALCFTESSVSLTSNINTCHLGHQLQPDVTSFNQSHRLSTVPPIKLVGWQNLVIT